MNRVKIAAICDKIILFSIYGIAFYLPISKAIIEVLSTLAIVSFIVKKIAQRQGIPHTHLNLAVIAYLIICFSSIFISTSTKISTRTFFGKYLQDILFFLVVAESLNTERRIKIFLYILFSSSALLGIDGICQHFTDKDFIRNRPNFYIPRIHATFPASNDFACYLYMVIPFVLASFFIKIRFKFFKFLFGVLFTLLFTCLVLTVSRGGWFAFLSTVLFMSIWLPSLGIFLLILGIFAVVARESCFPLLKQRLLNFFDFSDIGVDREKIWQAGWGMFRYNPWLGLGLGTFMFNFQKFIAPDYPYAPSYAHNCYLQMLSETGVIGLGAFLFILALFFYDAVKMINTQKKTFFWYILLTSTGAVLGFCVQMVVDTNFYSLDLGLLFWLILGLGAAATKGVQETIQ